MIDKNRIQLILEKAINAPSGANSQPWSFSVDPTLKLTIHLYPEKDHKILNYRNRGTLIALGCLLKNIEHAAHAEGYAIAQEPFSFEHNTVAITFQGDTHAAPCNLDSFIEARTTNRKPFASTALTDDELALLQNAAFSKRIQCTLLSDRPDITLAAEAFSSFERIMVEDDQIREHSFKEIVWSSKDAHVDHSGLYIDTLELAPPKRFILKLLQSSKIAVALAKRVGLPKVIAKDTAALYASGPVIGMLTVDDNDESYIEAGKVFENIWLQTTALGLYLQPMIGMVFLKQFADAHPSAFSEVHNQMISEKYGRLCTLCDDPPQGMSIAVGFRIGRSEPPSVRTQKAKPVVTFT